MPFPTIKRLQNLPKRDLTDVGNYVSSTAPQNRYIEMTTKPRTQGIISQTLLGGGGLLSVGRKDPRGFLCVCPEGKDARNSHGISFRTHSK